MATVTKNQKMLEQILSEVKNLREEVSFFVPTEELGEYRNKTAIKNAYKKATGAHPPLWK